MGFGLVKTSRDREVGRPLLNSRTWTRIVSRQMLIPIVHVSQFTMEELGLGRFIRTGAIGTLSGFKCPSIDGGFRTIQN